MQRLLLASTSPYRQQLLQRLGVPFTAQAPDADEAEIESESPSQRALRLALAKARSIRNPAAIVIGSDQVAALGERVLHKPGSAKRALEQLSACQGKTVDFFTAVAVCADTQTHTHLDHTQVRFRTLPQASLEYYITQDQPLNCAGGFKAEGLGIALFEQIDSRDPTALIGLPLAWLADTLRRCGVDPLSPDAAS